MLLNEISYWKKQGSQFKEELGSSPKSKTNPEKSCGNWLQARGSEVDLQLRLTICFDGYDEYN
jgi:hypothetical protein